MDLFFRLLSSMFLFIIVVGANHDSTSEPLLYWRTVLPHTPMPSAIAQLLQPGAYAAKPDTSVNVGKGGVNVNTGKGTSVNVGKGGGVNVDTGKGTSVNVGPGGVNVDTGHSKPSSPTVNVGKGGVNVHTGTSKPPGGGTSVSVGKGGVNVHTGTSKPPGGGGTSVSVGKGGVNVGTGTSKPPVGGGGTSVGVGKGGVNVSTGKGTSVNVGHGGVGVQTGPTQKPAGGTSVNVGKGGVGVAVKPKGKPVVVHVSPFIYNYAATDTQLRDDPAAALFFLRGDLRPGKKFALQLTSSPSSGGRTSGGFIPRGEAEAVPFSSGELPSVLSRFGIAEGSGEAEAAGRTVRECEEPAAAGERKLCATSLEAMVDFATGSLRTRLVVAVGTEGAARDQKRGEYEVERVTRLGGGKEGVVACHPEAYAYAVFFCHATGKAEAYEVELEAVGAGGTAGGKVKAVAVCHTDTAGWNPKHLAFRVLKVRPGTVPVCHFLPPDHVVWAAAAGRV